MSDIDVIFWTARTYEGIHTYDVGYELFNGLNSGRK